MPTVQISDGHQGWPGQEDGGSYGDLQRAEETEWKQRLKECRLYSQDINGITIK